MLYIPSPLKDGFLFFFFFFFFWYFLSLSLFDMSLAINGRERSEGDSCECYAAEGGLLRLYCCS